MEERMELISYKEIDDEKKEIIYSVVNKVRKDAEEYWPAAHTLELTYTCAKDHRIGVSLNSRDPGIRSCEFFDRHQVPI